MRQVETYLGDEDICPKASDEVFVDTIKHPEVFIWDAWSLVRPDGTVSLFTLSQPRASFGAGRADIQTQRDHLPHHWRRFDSLDDCKTWHDKGPVFAPRKDRDSFDSRSIWTGSACAVTINGADYVLAGYTGLRQKGGDYPYLQSLGLAVEDSQTGNFYRTGSGGALLDPVLNYDYIRDHGYYLGPRESLGHVNGEILSHDPADSNFGAAMAWRDPSIVVSGNEIHLFWSAKMGRDSFVEPAIGHGILKGDILNSPELELLPPVRLSNAHEITQSEVPQIIYDELNQRYLMMVSTSDRVSEKQTDAYLKLAVSIYSSKTLAGVFNLVTRVIEPHDRKFPGAIVSKKYDDDGNVCVRYMAPYNRSNGTDLMHTMPKIAEAFVPR